MIRLPQYSTLILMGLHLVFMVAIGLLIKRGYRLHAAALFAAKPTEVPASDECPAAMPLTIVVDSEENDAAHIGATLLGAARGTTRWLLYIGCGLAVLSLTDWMFFPQAGRAERWTDYWFTLGPMALILLVLGQLKIRVASSGLWAFAFMMGFSIAISVFGLVFVTIPAVWEQVQRGWLYALLAIPGVMILVFLLMLSLRLVYYMARGVLWLHQALGRLARASPLYIGMVFFWAWAIYFAAISQLIAGEAEFEKLGKFLLVPMVLYAALASALLWLMKFFTPKHRPVGLLFLRSFADGRRSQRLFRSLAIDWTEIGPVYALNGPDIVDATLDSATLSAFLSDNLESQFIANQQDIDRRMAAIRSERGWDFQYRVEEFKCLGPVWTEVFQKLSERSDMVLLDLRGFARANTGSAFELFTLLRSGKTQKSLLLCDKSTNRTDIERIARVAASAAPAGLGKIVLTEVHGGIGAPRRVMRRLLSIVSARPYLDVPSVISV